jgi:hypothetical protein
MFSQKAVNLFFDSGSSKQKVVPLSFRSTHQSILLAFAMREASERKSSSCRPEARTIKQLASDIVIIP